MQIDLIAQQETLAQRGAELLAEAAREAIRQRGRFLLAVSGGTAPWIMFEAFSKQNVEWDKVHLFQVDERVAPAGDPDRNLTHLCESLLEHAPLYRNQIHAMPVESP